MSSAIDNGSVTSLYSSLVELCSSVGDDSNRRYFATVDDQLDVFLHFKDAANGLHSLDQWYVDRFLPTIHRHEVQMQKSKGRSEHAKQLADSYAEYALEKSFEHINNAIRYAPFTERDLLCECFYLRSELHRYFSATQPEEAIQDLTSALHFRPHSFTVISQQVCLLIEAQRRGEAYRLVHDALKEGHFKSQPKYFN